MFYHGISQVEAIRKNKADSTILTLEMLFRYRYPDIDDMGISTCIAKTLCIIKKYFFFVIQICKHYLFKNAKEV